MARLGSWIEPFPQGIYVRPADAWVDPSVPKPLALVTHGHADHARGGHQEVWATPETLAIMETRYGPLLKAGVQVYEYNRTMMHHKIMVVDHLWSTVGTTNFDNRSFSHNEENNVCLCDEAFARELSDTFERDILVCEQVTLESWKRRPLLEKTAEALASFVQDQV